MDIAEFLGLLRRVGTGRDLSLHDAFENQLVISYRS